MTTLGAVGVAFGGAIGNSIVQTSVEKLFDKFASMNLNCAREKGILEELKKWEKNLKKIYAVLDVAEEQQWTNLLVKTWVKDLRNLAYDVDDVLDELDIEARRRNTQGEAEPAARPSKVLRIFPTIAASMSSAGTVAMFSFDMDSKIKEISGRLDEILKDKDDLHLGESTRRGSSHQVRTRLPSTCLVNEAEIHGRENDLKEIFQLLKAQESNAKLSVIPILGIGGVGKTTLAQLVYNNTSSLQFDFKGWVSVGEDFDVLQITKRILSGEADDKQDLNWHQLKLKEKLSMKKFLIVLDDIWTENYEAWTSLCAPFKAGAEESTVIITTRSQKISAMMGTVPAYTLKELSDDACMLVFTQHALGATNFDEHGDLKELGGRIVKRCKGLPLAAKALGGVLRGEPADPNAWNEVLTSELWDLSDEQSNILPALRLSYFHLPSHLKQCFAYCAIFPKDYEFDVNELVWLWMAEGFLHQPTTIKQKKGMEDIGHEYFLHLLRRSFFQRCSNSKSRYVMHDLMNDLARHVSRDVCFQLGGELEDEKSYAMIRHLSFIRCKFDAWQKFEVCREMKGLRTFLSMPILADCLWPEHHLTSKVLDELVPESKCLRVLSLAGYHIVKLPSSIGALKHLRYLNLSFTEIQSLPESVVGLINLQTLRLRGCRKLTELPPDIGNLINLHFLYISQCEKLTELPSGIGNLINLHCLDIRACSKLTKLPLVIKNLTNLQRLHANDGYLKEMPPKIGNLKKLNVLTRFIVGKDNGLKLGELEKLSKLQGKLCIKELQNVVDIGDADLAKLEEKKGIEELELKWSTNDSSGSRNLILEVRVLNSLRPAHKELSSILIDNFGGTELPSWLGDPSFKKMVKLRLVKCRNIESLPPLGQLPSLRELRMDGMDRLEKVGVEFFGDGSSCFPCLEILYISDMREWEQWTCCSNDAAVRFPKLSDLRVFHCPKLIERSPISLPSLHKLRIGLCEKAFLPSMSDFRSLTTLEIEENVLGLVSLDEAHIEVLVALQFLTIKYCHQLKYLWNNIGSNLDKLASLKSIEIYGCHQLVSLVQGEEEELRCCGELPFNLEDLRISYCSELRYLWKDGSNLDKLASLHIVRCGMVSLVEGEEEEWKLPCNLQDLKINFCHKLKSLSARGVPCSLRHLEVRWCMSFESVGEGIIGNQMSQLEKLIIENCPSLNLSPNGPTLASLNGFSHLTKLEIVYCPLLERLPEMGSSPLSDLSIVNCQNLRSLPIGMHNLTHLQSFKISYCGGLGSFPEGGLPQNLIHFSIRGCHSMKQPMSEWGLHSLTSLTHLRIEGRIPSTNMFESFPDDDDNQLQLLPDSVTHLEISDFKNLKSISSSILHLTSLICLKIRFCNSLQSLPEEGFPPTLGLLNIPYCPPRVKKWCSHHKSIILPITYVELDEPVPI